MIQEQAQALIKEAIDKRASDIYLQPINGHYHVQARVQDDKISLMTLTESDYNALIAHFKFLVGMNVGEKRRIQSGSVTYDYGEGYIFLRLSSVGDVNQCESLVIRLIYQDRSDMRFWFDEDQEMDDFLNQRGLYLFAGPVGSGKTTLMYHLIEQHTNRQVIAIEDPVEIKHSGMLRLQINEAIGLSYDALIKLSLRHRPDILIIGEIRDTKTAKAVIRASLTGAMVLSTVHAKSIPAVYDRMIELGISQKELDACLCGISYQRLLKGGGIVDVAKENFTQHSSEVWNGKVARLYDGGYLTAQEKERETLKDQARSQNYSVV